MLNRCSAFCIFCFLQKNTSGVRLWTIISFALSTLAFFLILHLQLCPHQLQCHHIAGVANISPFLYCYCSSIINWLSNYIKLFFSQEYSVRDWCIYTRQINSLQNLLARLPIFCISSLFTELSTPQVVQLWLSYRFYRFVWFIELLQYR